MTFKFGWLFGGPVASTSISPYHYQRGRTYEKDDKTVAIEFADGTTQVLEDALFFHYPEPSILPWFHLVFKRPYGLKLSLFGKPFIVRTDGKEFRDCLFTEKECNFALDFFILKGHCAPATTIDV